MKSLNNTFRLDFRVHLISENKIKLFLFYFFKKKKKF